MTYTVLRHPGVGQDPWLQTPLMVVVFHDDHSGTRDFVERHLLVALDTGLRRYDEVVLDTGSSPA